MLWSRCVRNGQRDGENSGAVMKFSYLEDAGREWSDILVIGKTIERDNRKYHIVGMTLGNKANLYIIEPYSEQESGSHGKKRVCNQRRIMKDNVANSKLFS